MKYKNPVILGDYSDPDVIRVGDDFFMVASSFNHVPGVPVLHSKNLVEWHIVGHVLKNIPFKRFDKVQHGHGAWAPSIRYHGNKFYCTVPFPDEGIYVAETDDPFGEWSPLRPLLLGKGFEDPCPVWIDGKCYVVFAFVRSRIGFNSRLALLETDEGMTKTAQDYKIIYCEPDVSPCIEGPKFYRHGEYFYILAPAGGVSTGWQVALRSKSVSGPYETKIVMVQGDTDVNGPHQGALIDLDDGGERWAFMHFQKMGPFGRVVHLQPAVWENGWPICGQPTYDNLPGNPVEGGDYPVDVKTDYKIDPAEKFSAGALPPVWQTPANPKEGWFGFEKALRLNCVEYGGKTLADLPQLLMQKVQYLDFEVNLKLGLHLEDGDECGLAMFGREYGYVCVTRRGDKTFVEMRRGAIGGESDDTVESVPVRFSQIHLTLQATYENRHNLRYRFICEGCPIGGIYYASSGVWVGAKIGIYARSDKNSKGYALVEDFSINEEQFV